MGTDPLVELDNRFGDITIGTWDENAVSLEAKVLVEGMVEQLVIDQIKLITVDIKGSRDAVSMTTEIENIKQGKWNSNKKIEYRIDYSVNMPASARLDLENKYGDVLLESINGTCKIKVNYGALHAENLTSRLNKIELNYARGSDIENMDFGKVILSYSDLEIDNAQSIEVQAKYSDLEIDNIESMTYFGRYDKLDIKHVTEATINSKYSTVKIDEVGTQLLADIEYSNLIVDHVKPGFEKVQVQNSYGPVNIGFNSEASFAFTTSGKYCGVACPEKATYTNKTKDSKGLLYEGYVGNGTSESLVDVESSYGSVKLKVD